VRRAATPRAARVHRRGACGDTHGGGVSACMAGAPRSRAAAAERVLCRRRRQRRWTGRRPRAQAVRCGSSSLLQWNGASGFCCVPALRSAGPRV
jgi:hypothetical protein